MITRIGMAPRRPGLDITTFQKHWCETHAALVSELSGVKRYWQNHAILENGEALLPWPGFDACSDFDFADLAEMEAGFTSEKYLNAVKADEAYLVDKTRGGLILASKHILSGTPNGEGIRLLTFYRAAPHIAFSDLSAALQGQPTPKNAQAHELFLALKNIPHISIYDAVEALWFDNTEAAKAWLVSGEAREARYALSGLVHGTERLIAQVLKIV